MSKPFKRENKVVKKVCEKTFHSLHPKTDAVKNHYEKWPFPDTSFNGRESLILLKYLHEILDCNSLRKKTVIDVGCGTGHGTIAIAKHFPGVRFVGLDISTTSIQKGNEQIRERQLANVVFCQGDICLGDRLPADRFDLVLSTGVLHHIKNARIAFNNLVHLLNPGGTIILWLYGRYGRMRHNLNQAFIAMLARRRPLDEREELAAEFIGRMGAEYALDSGFYTPRGSGNNGLDWLLNHKQWLTDQMMPPCEHGYTIKEILSLFRQHCLIFQKWLGVSVRLESYTSSPLLLEKFNRLKFEERLLAIDLLIKPEYYFISGSRETERLDGDSGNQRL